MDAVRRLLAEGEWYTRPATLMRLATHRVPLFPPALGLIAGIGLCRVLHPPAWAFSLGLAPAVVGLGAILLLRGRASPAVLVLVAGLAFAGVGLTRAGQDSRIGPHDARRLLAGGPRPVALRGWVLSDLQTDDPNRALQTLRPATPSTRFPLQLRQVETTAGWVPIRGRVRVWVGGQVSGLQPGDPIELYAWLDRPQPPANPGQFDVASYLEDQGIVGVATVKSEHGITRLPPSLTGLPVRVVASMRRGARRALTSHWPTSPQTLGLAQALLLGYRQDIDSRLHEAFRRTGLLHFVSLSGMHFGILVGIIWFLAKTAGLLRPARAAVCGVAAAVFLVMVPATAPTLRAAILCWVFCGAIVLRRQSHPVNTLALAALILLLARPTQLCDVSWQLSFACMLGIFTLSRPIERALLRWTGLDPSSSPSETAAAVRLLRRASQYLISLGSVGLGAWVGSAGISLYYFYGLTPLSAAWTLLVLPGVWLVMTLGLAKILAAFLIPALGPLMASLVAGSTGGLIWTVQRIAELDLSSLRIGRIGAAPILLFYALVLLFLFAPRRHPVARRTVLAGLAVVVVTWVGWTKWNHTHHPDLRLTCLAVGHGQAIVAQIPGARALLFDAGSLYGGDIGTRIVNPFLDYAGLSGLDAVVVSHTDADHLNGLPEVLRHVRTHALYADLGQARAETSQARDADAPQTSDLLRQSLDEEGIPLRPLAEMPNDWGHGADLALLWPRPDCPIAPAQLSDNNRSAVVLIRFAGRQVLLCSDIEQDAQKVVLSLYPDLRADVLVVPHHGSTKTLAPGFVDRIDPKVLICSCSPSQARGGQVLQPSDDQVAFYTGRDGAITIRIEESGGIQVAAHLGPAYALGPHGQ